MTSSSCDLLLANLSCRLNALVEPCSSNDERLRPAWLGLRGLAADGLASRWDLVAGDFFDQGDHFLWVSLPNYL